MLHAGFHKKNDIFIEINAFGVFHHLEEWFNFVEDVVGVLSHDALVLRHHADDVPAFIDEQLVLPHVLFDQTYFVDGALDEATHCLDYHLTRYTRAICSGGGGEAQTLSATKSYLKIEWRMSKSLWNSVCGTSCVMPNSTSFTNSTSTFI